MAAPVVFDSVWKKFRRGQRLDSLRDVIPEMAKSVFRRRHPEELENAQEFWAVKDVSFEVNHGEALGIIGPNGAGKSTTLKLLTKILRPTRGHCAVRGRVGALIEVAAGFHPDLTGLENIYLQGAIMGMRRDEIKRRLDAIIDFAGVADFVETPVKRYSSGMNARLGFSIAAHLDPEVLIIDEVLSVGDAAFQAKCVERMHEFRKAGVTVVFVSHNLQAIANLCSSALFIKQGVQAIGPTTDVLTKYVSVSSASTASGSDDVEIVSSELVGHGKTVTASPGQRLKLRVTYRAVRRVENIMFAFVLHRSTDSLVVYDGNVSDTELGIGVIEAGQSVTVDYEFAANLVRGHYHAHCRVFHQPTQKLLGRLNPAGMINIVEGRTFRGIADVELVATPVVPFAGAQTGARR